MNLCSLVCVWRQSRAGSFHSGEGWDTYLSSKLLTRHDRSPLMAFDFVIMVLAGFKSVQHYRRVPDKNWSGARFMKTLARDSFIYFAWWALGYLYLRPENNLAPSNFFNYLAITFVFHLAPPEFFQLGASWTIVIPPITASHLLINMEQSRFRDANSTTNSSTSEESDSSKEIELTQCCVRNIPSLAVT